ncbi:Hypothetical predicted protein, partial [Xyrichtys novacula]
AGAVIPAGSADKDLIGSLKELCLYLNHAEPVCPEARVPLHKFYHEPARSDEVFEIYRMRCEDREETGGWVEGEREMEEE